MRTDRRVRVVFLDMGDTLVRLNASLNAAYVRAAAVSGQVIDDDHLARSLSEVVRETDERNRAVGFEATREADRRYWHDFNSRILQRLEIAEHLWAAAYQEIERTFVDPANFAIFPDVPEALDRLRLAGYRLAICSNWSWELPFLCEQLGFAGAFDQIIASARVGFAKPHPAIFRRALDLLGVRPEEAVHVGDNPIADVGGALQAGIQPVLLDRAGENAGVEVLYRIANLLELPALLQRIEATAVGSH